MTNKTDDNGKDTGLVSEIDRVQEMINSPQMRDMRERVRKKGDYIRPKNAATMILIDGSGSKLRVLMGRRNKNLKFMPGALVFPGGSVDRHDGSVKSCDELNVITQSRLLDAMRGRPTKRGARALAIAAIREVAEESGLLIGKPGNFSSDHEDWADFNERQIVPSMAGMRLFARAITPPGMPRRFDTWFFLARSHDVGFTPEGGFDPDGELEDLQWITPQAAILENTREITRVMLVELINRLRQDPDLSESFPAPYYHTIGSHFHKKLI
ncbi:MAG: NUDIX hydrolase [Rhizobiaceae bacterium]|nr:NUDIX hydrolase [Rhizobiaceae bacterium]